MEPSASLYPAELRHRFQALAPPPDAPSDDKITQIVTNETLNGGAFVDKGAAKSPSEVERGIVADLECALCCGLLWRPVTLSCGTVPLI